MERRFPAGLQLWPWLLPRHQRRRQGGNRRGQQLARRIDRKEIGKASDRHCRWLFCFGHRFLRRQQSSIRTNIYPAELSKREGTARPPKLRKHPTSNPRQERIEIT